MAWHFDNYDNSIVIDGWEKGIADNPYSGLSNMRNANIVSIPGEATVSFKTAQISSPAITTGTITGINAGANTFTYSGATGLEGGMAIVFSSVGSVTGISTNTPYWVKGTLNQLYTDFSLTTLVTLGGSAAGNPTFTSYNMAQPKAFTYDSFNQNYYLIDASGQVWTNRVVTSNNSYWVFTGNTGGNGTANGNGIGCYIANTGISSVTISYIFAFRNSAIDYLKITGSSPSWTYGWNPNDSTTGNSAGYLKTPNGTNNPHQMLTAPDNRAYYTDANWVMVFYQKSTTTLFDPTSLTTYTYSQFSILPGTDLAQCLTYLGTFLLIGGKGNIIYPWDRFSTNYAYQLLLPEFNVTNMVTVNTNTFIFIGNRGRIYVTNGTNVNLYKKIPDHISGTIEPYFTWGAATTYKNQLYFGVSAKDNAGNAINQYGGLWAIDLDTDALRLTNKLSYGSYAGLAVALIPNFSTNPAGFGLFIGWDNGSSGYGIDTTVSTPYTNSECTIDSDLIPIGTFNKPREGTLLEYRLSRPLVSGESITIKTRLIYNTSDTGFSTGWSDSTVGNYSNTNSIDFKNAQWVQFQIVLNSTASSPSYVRLKEIRLLGMTGQTLAQNQILNV